MAISWRAGLLYLALGMFALAPLRPSTAYRRRRPARPAEPGTADHRWREIDATG